MAGIITHEEAFVELRATCVDDNSERIHKLFAAGCVNAENASKMLKIAVRRPRALRCLLEHGADPHKIRLSMIRSAETLRLFAEFGYDFKTYGSLILHNWAADRATLDWLLDQGADINQTDTGTGTTAEGFPLYPGGEDHSIKDSIKVLNNVAANGDVELFDHLVHRGADPSRSLALHYASKCQDSEQAAAMISHLLGEHKMNINADTDDLRNFFHQAPDSGTPLCSAIYRKSIAVIEALLSRGADPIQSGASGVAPVGIAIGDAMFDGFLPALQPLLDAEADINIALQGAVAQEKTDMSRAS